VLQQNEILRTEQSLHSNIVKQRIFRKLFQSFRHRFYATAVWL